jgi:hypothetical protein
MIEEETGGTCSTRAGVSIRKLEGNLGNLRVRRGKFLNGHYRNRVRGYGLDLTG